MFVQLQEKKSSSDCKLQCPEKQAALIRLKTEQEGKAVITRISEENPSGNSKEITWNFMRSILKIEPGETVYIEFTE